MAVVALTFLMVFTAMSLPTAQAAEDGIPGQVHTVPTHYESDDTIDWGPTLVIWGCMIFFAVGVTGLILSRLMAWIRKWG